jgi:Domain of unknown function (DUF3244)
MRRIITAAAFTACSAIFSPLQAQMLSTTTGNETSQQEAENKQDWSIFTDKQNNMVYVDFEKINVNLSGVNVRDNAGQIVFKDDSVWQLPVNTIYEVDLSKFPKGEYTVELKTFTSSLKKKVNVN